VWASLLTFAITVIHFLVIYEFITTGNLWLILGYALGNSAGTFAGMKIHISKPDLTKK
jgi:hypothetical protein